MFDAQTLLANNPTATVVYSPWFRRGGDYSYFSLDVDAISSASATLKVELAHKKAEDAGDGTLITGSTFQSTAVGRTIYEFASGAPSGFTGFLDLVRYKFTLTSSSGSQWATFRMLPPLWYDAAKG